MAKLLEGIGYTLNQGPAGISLMLDNTSGGGGADHPFKVKLSGLKFSVVPGTVNGVMPKLDGTNLDNSPKPTKTISASGQVYLKCTNTAGSFFPSAVTVEYDTSTPSSTDSYLYIPIATVVVSGSSSKKTAQLVETSLWAEYLKCGSNPGEYFVCRS